MRVLLIFLLFLFSLSGCVPDRESAATSGLVRYLKRMIDDGEVHLKYVLVCELASTEYGNVYHVIQFLAPMMDTIQIPYKVIEYKDKYICLKDLTSSKRISDEELAKLPEDTTSHACDFCFGGDDYAGVSKDGQKVTMVYHKYRPVNRIYAYPELSEYLFADPTSNHFVLDFEDMLVDSMYGSDRNLAKHLRYLKGTVFCSNPLDTCLKHPNDRCSDWDWHCTDCKDSADTCTVSLEDLEAERSFFAIQNGKDTLRFSVDESSCWELHVTSLANPSFFASLPEEDTWPKLYSLFHDSIFYFRHTQDGYVKQKVFLEEFQYEFPIQALGFEHRREKWVVFREGFSMYMQNIMLEENPPYPYLR